ncbi:hypothetical protein CDD83_7671 [Cordyceps sp. RAO-2017]|nr:hypothetical protein CDD83_7671 [Cordyceps sp. RAO-2017]
MDAIACRPIPLAAAPLLPLSALHDQGPSHAAPSLRRLALRGIAGLLRLGTAALSGLQQSVSGTSALQRYLAASLLVPQLVDLPWPSSKPLAGLDLRRRRDDRHRKLASLNANLDILALPCLAWPRLASPVSVPEATTSARLGPNKQRQPYFDDDSSPPLSLDQGPTLPETALLSAECLLRACPATLPSSPTPRHVCSLTISILSLVIVLLLPTTSLCPDGLPSRLPDPSPPLLLAEARNHPLPPAHGAKTNATADGMTDVAAEPGIGRLGLHLWIHRHPTVPPSYPPPPRSPARFSPPGRERGLSALSGHTYSACLGYLFKYPAAASRCSLFVGRYLASVSFWADALVRRRLTGPTTVRRHSTAPSAPVSASLAHYYTSLPSIFSPLPLTSSLASCSSIVTSPPSSSSSSPCSTCRSPSPQPRHTTLAVHHRQTRRL